jgi:CheY-like chemotaxis protein
MSETATSDTGCVAEDLSPSAPRPATILLVDSLDACRVTTKWFLSTFGYVVESVRSAAEALALFNPSIHDVIVTDNLMLGLTGVEMAQIIKQRSPSTPVILYSEDVPDDQTSLDVVIQRPIHLLALKEAVGRLVVRRE